MMAAGLHRSFQPSCRRPWEATKPKAELLWSPKQFFTAGRRPVVNVCRAELDRVEVTQARSAGVAGTKLVLRNAVQRDELDRA